MSAVTTRPRGFAEWKPHNSALVLLSHVFDVLREYENYLPLTLRQVYYRLVGRGVLDKTERVYANLGEMLNRARRSGMVPFDAIRDDGVTVDLGGDHVTAADQIKDLREHGHEGVVHDVWLSQPRRVIVWCEAAGMVPQLRQAKP